jgi:hypothetical protein
VTLPAPADRVRLVLVGDSGIYDSDATDTCDPNTDASVLPEVCREVLFASLGAESPDAVLALGDLVYEIGPTCPDGVLTDAARTILEDLVGAVQTAAQAPLVLALGNHDVHHSASGKSAAETCFMEYAAERDDVHFPERNFLVDIGPATVLVLDTNRAMTESLAEGISEALGTRTAPWTFFAAHHVWRTYYDKEGQDQGPRWSEQLGITPAAWLNGHAHFLQFGVYDGVPAVTSGASGKLRASDPCGGDEAACDRDGLLYSRTKYGYAVLDVTPDLFEIVFKDVEGTPLFGWRKAAGESGVVVSF